MIPVTPVRFPFTGLSGFPVKPVRQVIACHRSVRIACHTGPSGLPVTPVRQDCLSHRSVRIPVTPVRQDSLSPVSQDSLSNRSAMIACHTGPSGFPVIPVRQGSCHLLSDECGISTAAVTMPTASGPFLSFHVSTSTVGVNLPLPSVINRRGGGRFKGTPYKSRFGRFTRDITYDRVLGISVNIALPNHSVLRCVFCFV